MLKLGGKKDHFGIDAYRVQYSLGKKKRWTLPEDIISENAGNKALKVLLIDHNDKITVPLFSRSLKINITDDLISWIEDNPLIDYKVN